MSDQKFPDGEFAKQAVALADHILSNIEKKSYENLTREEYLKAIAEAVNALCGYT